MFTAIQPNPVEKATAVKDNSVISIYESMVLIDICNIVPAAGIFIIPIPL